jgi:hypothetical protein
MSTLSATSVLAATHGKPIRQPLSTSASSNNHFNIASPDATVTTVSEFF